MSIVKWRKMESAPKDGTVIDIWMQGTTQYRAVDCYWTVPKTPPSYETDKKGYWIDSEGNSLSEDGRFVPVLWIEIPPPLQVSQEEQNLCRRVDELIFSHRARWLFRNENIVHIGDLVRFTEHEVLMSPNIGLFTLNELKVTLGSLGLRFGMKGRDDSPS